MSRHRAPRRRQAALRSLAFGGAAVVALAGVQGTYAYWTDQATVSGDTLTSGTLDLDVDGVDDVTASVDLTFPTLVPGNSVAKVITVSNGGTAPLTWTAATTATNGTLAAAMTVKVTADSTVTGTKPTATCAGTPLSDGTTTLGGPLLSTPRPLASGAAQPICVQITLRSDAASSLQDQSTGISLLFDASQLTP